MRSITILMVLMALACCAKADTREEFLKELKKVSKDCQKQENASDEDLEDFKHHRSFDTKEGKCMMACILEKFETLNSEDKLDKEKILKTLKDLDNNEEQLRKGGEVVDACLNIEVPNDRCEKSQTYVDCLRKEAKARDIEFLFIWGEDL